MGNSCEVNEKPKTWKEYLKSKGFIRSVIAIAIGVLGGFLYYYFVGCTSGTCAITSNPYASMAFGGFFGYFLVNRPCAC
jgi:hypothetical protein